MRVLKKPKKFNNISKIKNNFFVFDVETTKLEPQPKNFIFGVIYGWNFKKIIYSVEEFKQEFSRKKYQNKYIFAHNAEFDLLTIYGNLYQNLDNSAVFNGNFILAKKDRLTFGDSLNIYPASVEKIGKLFSMEKIENEKIKKGELRKNNITNDDINYCIRDCEIIYNALLRIFENVGTIKLTISSLSMYDYRNEYLEKDLYFSDLVDDFYDSYYGGRTECFKIGEVEAKVFDINSLYPYVMRDIVFPDIRNLKKETLVDIKYLKYLLKNYEGLARIKVQHNDTYLGFLPYRDKKLLFPIGTFETTVNFNEIRFGLEHNAFEIIEVYHVVYGNPISSPFENFIEENYNERIKSDDSLNKLIYKLKMNSLYGRFAMRMKFETTYYNLIPYEIIEELDKTEKFYELKLFNQERSDCFLITENEKFKNSFFSIPTFSSYITSAARIELLKGLLANEKESIVYCDTDSIFLENSFQGKIGAKLGEYKDEKKEVVQIKGLKNYVYIDEEGKRIETIKGVSKNSKKIGENCYKKTQYYKTKESLRQNKDAGSKKVIIKELTHKYDKRIVLSDGDTKPLKL